MTRHGVADWVRSDALNRLADGNELLIARQLLDAPSVDSLEHHEVADEIEEIGRGEKPGEQDVLSGWRSTQLRRKRVEREWIGSFHSAHCLTGVRVVPYFATSRASAMEICAVSNKRGAPSPANSSRLS